MKNQLINIVKRIINEQGGFDDVNTMVLHNIQLYNEIGDLIDKLVVIIEQVHNAIELNVPKDKMLNGINRITPVLKTIAPKLDEIQENIYYDEYLKYAVKEMSKTIIKTENELSKLSHIQTGFHHPKFYKYSFGGGLGYDMSDEDFRNKLLSIFDKLHEDALTLSDVLIDSSDRNQQRADSLN